MTKLDQHQEIIQKQEILVYAKKQLKKEFIGIDNVIDQVIDLCSSWYLLPQVQEKPVVINLWGLTGVGKSSLVNRLSELLDYANKYYRFDLGDKSSSIWTIHGQIEEMYEIENGFPVILAFDEFQHVRSLDSIGNEIEKQSHRLIWELLDSGKFLVSRFNFKLSEVNNLILRLEYALSKGVKVVNGLVVSKKNIYHEIINEHEIPFISGKSSKQKVVYFFPQEYYNEIFELAVEKYVNYFGIKEELLQMDGERTITFLKEIMTFAVSPKTLDCSKSLIFVLGNLDEAYTMSSSYNPDMDADEFYKQSLKINISNIKQALRSRFRNEQIARLGNNHIIYPAFSKESFEKIIELELDKMSKKIKNEYQLDLKFESSLLDLIYDEGVYPTQGTRPIFSTIYQMVGSKIGKMISQLYLNKIQADSIYMKVENEEIKIIYYDQNRITFSFCEKPILNLSKLRKNKKDDVQAIVAVHETGHALISIFLLNTIPDVIYSKTAGVRTDGFVYANFKWKYISKKEILSRIAFFLGGIIAEKIIFGDENITNGSESDIEKATNFVARMLKESGMGKLPASYQVDDVITNNKLFDKDNKVNLQVKYYIEQAEQLAFQILKKQEYLLIQMADFLSDNRVLRKFDIKDYLIKYAKDYNIEDIIENGDHLFYRDYLKHKISSIKLQENIQTFGNEFSLNKELLK